MGGTCLSHQPPPHTSPLHKMFNRNTVKLVAVSCPPPPNVRSIFQSLHNWKVFQQARDHSEPQLCNCKIRNDFPVMGFCLTTHVIYQADISTTNGDILSYIGMTGRSFKSRYANHKKYTFAMRNTKRKQSCPSVLGN